MYNYFLNFIYSLFFFFGLFAFLLFLFVFISYRNSDLRKINRWEKKSEKKIKKYLKQTPMIESAIWKAIKNNDSEYLSAFVKTYNEMKPKYYMAVESTPRTIFGIYLYDYKYIYPVYQSPFRTKEFPNLSEVYKTIIQKLDDLN